MRKPKVIHGAEKKRLEQKYSLQIGKPILTTDGQKTHHVYEGKLAWVNECDGRQVCRTWLVYKWVRLYSIRSGESRGKQDFKKHLGCKFSDCDNPHSCKGYCATHYQSFYYIR